MQQKFMPWVDLLPEVGSPIRNERNNLAANLAEAAELEKQAAAIRAAVRAGRVALLNHIMTEWSLRDIVQAATAPVARDQPFQPGFVKDGDLREALRALDGAPSPLEVLQAFQAGRVIRQQNLFSTATEEDHRATLRRVSDWWNYGAVPVLTRFED